MAIKMVFPLLALAGLFACKEQAPPPADVQDVQKDAAVQKQAEADDVFVRTPARPGTMFKVDYRIVGTPVVGSPVATSPERARSRSPLLSTTRTPARSPICTSLSWLLRIALKRSL